MSRGGFRTLVYSALCYGSLTSRPTHLRHPVLRHLLRVACALALGLRPAPVRGRAPPGRPVHPILRPLPALAAVAWCADRCCCCCRRAVARPPPAPTATASCPAAPATCPPLGRCPRRCRCCCCCGRRCCCCCCGGGDGGQGHCCGDCHSRGGRPRKVRSCSGAGGRLVWPRPRSVPQRVHAVPC